MFELNEVSAACRLSLVACRLSLVAYRLSLPPGEYFFGPTEEGAKFVSDGTVGRMPEGGLASSIMGMDTMVRTMARATRAALPDVIRMASLTPAERAGVARQVGSLAQGKLADVLVLDRKLAVKRVFIGGCEHLAQRPGRGV